MEVSANVETDLESVPLSDNNDENYKISKTICLDDDVEESKNVFDENFVSVNNGDINDTEKSHGTNTTNESVSTSKDVIGLDSNDVSDKAIHVDEPVDNVEVIDAAPSLNNDPEDLLSVALDEENLLDEIHSGEIHSGEFNATSSPINSQLNSDQLDNSEQTIDDDSYEVNEVSEIENHHKIEEEEEEQDEDEDDEEIDHEVEHEEEPINSKQSNEDDGTIVLDDDDEDEDNNEDEDDDEDDEDDDETDNEDEESDDDGSDKNENDKVDISVSSDDSEDDDVEVKVPVKPKFIPSKKKKMVYDYRRKAIKTSIKM